MEICSELVLGVQSILSNSYTVFSKEIGHDIMVSKFVMNLKKERLVIGAKSLTNNETNKGHK